MAKEIVSDALVALRARMAAQKAKFFNSIEAAHAALQSIPNVDVNSSIWNVGDQTTLPEGDALAENLTVTEFNGTSVPAIMCDNGKLLYLSSLKKKVPEYGQDLQPTGKIFHSGTKLFAAVDKLGTADCLDLIAGKTIKVTGMQHCTGARYGKDRTPISVRNVNIPEFELV